MSLKDFEMLKAYGIQCTSIAERMGVTENLLRYHLLNELKNPKTKERFKKALLNLSFEIQDDLGFAPGARKKRYKL